MVLCSWSSDGTENGTVQVGEIYPGSEDSDMRYLTPAAGVALVSRQRWIQRARTLVERWHAVRDAVRHVLPAFLTRR